MCARFTLLTPGKDLVRRFKLDDVQTTVSSSTNIAPTETAFVVIEEGGRRRLEPMLFGLIPHWAKDPRIAGKLLNARAETVDRLPSFRESFRARRCLVVADGWYEWRGEGKKRIPYRFALKSREPFAFAGLWDRWRRPNGKDVKTFCIVTTEANAVARAFHDRMPVVMESENEPLWLSPHISETRTLKPLLKPFPDDLLDAYRVSEKVNKPQNKEPDCIEPVADLPA